MTAAGGECTDFLGSNDLRCNNGNGYKAADGKKKVIVHSVINHIIGMIIQQQEKCVLIL